MDPNLFSNVRSNWRRSEVVDLFELPFNDLLFLSHSVHRMRHQANRVQLSTLLSIKTGACPEDCKYCSQSGHYNTDLEKEKLLSVEKVIASAKSAKLRGATRFCMGAAWRSPSAKDLPLILHMVKEVKSLGLETCMTLGMLGEQQAQTLAEAGLDYYNHNLDTSQEYYQAIITTRSYQDRLDTLQHVRDAGIKVCAGGILGMGEARADRIGLLLALANLQQHPESVPINQLVPIEGTPLADVDPLDAFELVRMVAVARLLMPKSVIRLSAGREQMSEQTQALCFFAGANSIFYGERLLTTDNPQSDADLRLFEKLGIKAMSMEYDETSNVASIKHQRPTQSAQKDVLYYDAMQS